MILSVSRRTDIPACYPDWFMRRLREGYAMVRSPFNLRQVSRVSLSREAVDCIVFWTKNPAPLLPHLPEIARMGYPCLFQVTLNAYGTDVERALPPLHARVEAMRTLAGLLGPERVTWRYDPILLSADCTVDWHVRQFAALAQALEGCTERCVISFLDVYDKIRRRLREQGLRAPEEAEVRQIARALAQAAASHGMAIQTCAEHYDLSDLGVEHGACIDGQVISRILGKPLKLRRDAGQRSTCGCVASVDVGAYNTCGNGCVYCYANFSPETTARQMAAHCPDSPLLTGQIGPEDRVTERAMPTCLADEEQLSLL